MNTKKKIEIIEFVFSLNLDWEERLSLEYSNGLSTYWEIYHSYQRQITFRKIIDYIPLIASVGVASYIIGIIKEVTADNSDLKKG